jgi:integrase/recombinase XerD
MTRMTPLRRRMIDDMTLRNFTPKTIQAYVRCVARFARYFNCSPKRLGPEQVRAFLLHLLQERGYSISSYNQTRCALRFVYRVTLGRDDVPASIVPARQPRTLPVVLSSGELVRLFAAIGNLKHRAILITAYAAGLRVSEVSRLRVQDIDSQPMVIHVCQGKGQKDRYVMLSPRLLEILRTYWKALRPRGYLFPGATPDQPIPTNTIRKACQRACQKAGLGKHVTVHTLRNASAYYTTFRRIAYFQGNSCCPGVRFRSWRPA